MCGVAGWVDWDRDLRTENNLIVEMTRTMASRGPDAEAVWASRHAALGHRRLAVVDVLGGSQPMIYSRPGALWVATFAGEISNFEELRSELKTFDHVFVTRSDTEVLLHAYARWGERCVDRLSGMFAFAIWDDARQTLFLARDRLGVKPLFYAERDQALFFGSEIKALLRHPAVPAEVDKDGLAELFSMDGFRTPGHGVFRHIRELRPGHSLTFSRRGLYLSRYWQFANKRHSDDLPATAAQVRTLINIAVDQQLSSDLPLCSMLSGGLDSSIVAALANRTITSSKGAPLDTYTIELERDEGHFRPTDLQPELDPPWARRAAAAINTNHRAIRVTTEAIFGHLRDVLLARDLPSVGSRDATMLVFCRAIRKSHAVALSGEGADEIFGGYPWFSGEAVRTRTAFPWHVSGEPGMARFLQPDLADRLKPADYEHMRLTEALAEVPTDSDTGQIDRMHEIQYLHLTRFLPALLERADRMSMASGLEVRVPFCDHHLLEYAWNIPWDIMTTGGREKSILRIAFEGLLPDDVLWRQKSAFPEAHDPAFACAMADRLLGVLDDTQAPIRPLIDVESARAAAQATIATGQAGRKLERALLGWVQMNQWLGHYRVSLV